MKKQVNGNGRINNTQRNVLSKLAVEVLDKKIQQARDESGELVAQIREQVRDELRTIKQSRASAIQIAELGHIINDSNIAEVVREELTSKDN